MDLNADGKLDVLSGCYDCLSEIDPDSLNMAGIFHVFWGEDKHKFKPASVLNGADGKPLISGSPFMTEEQMDQYDESKATPEESQAFMDASLDTFCTRPYAADLNDDGLLDLVVGNAAGTFFLVNGVGKGEFEPKSTQIMTGGVPLRVADKSDPFVVDWDSDGDLDIVSGTGQGGVFLALNEGTKSDPKFAEFQELVPASDWMESASKFGDSHISSPSASTRVCVADLNGDGAMDLLVGDSVTITFPADGLKEAEVSDKLEAWEKRMEEARQQMAPKQEKIFAKFNEIAGSKELSEEDRVELQSKLEQELNELYVEMAPLQEERAKIVREEMTGFVWVYFQKPPQSQK